MITKSQNFRNEDKKMGYQDPGPRRRRPKFKMNKDLMLDEKLEARVNYYRDDDSYNLEEGRHEIAYQGNKFCLIFEIKHLD